ncbi:MAG: hypothetical protein E7451_05705 [Ruminococcaceae bacterium]|nr:hypothetical protein [Oscillospiraceae bacterium]
MICIEIQVSGERRRIEREIWVHRQSNGMVVACPRHKAQGVCDGENTWSLGQLEGYPEARCIPLAEYLEAPANRTVIRSLPPRRH